jgi:hypothetical protein
VLNSARGEDRFRDYDEVESLLFSRAAEMGMPTLSQIWNGEVIPSQAFAEGGIHEAIIDYENSVFFDILAEELVRRDMQDAPIDETNCEEFYQRMDLYLDEFEAHGTDHVQVELSEA